jgi:hypothetical protein
MQLNPGFFFPWPACKLSFVGARTHTTRAGSQNTSLITAQSTGCKVLSEQRRLRATDRAAIPASRAGQRLTARTRNRSRPLVASCVLGWLSLVFFLIRGLCESNVRNMLLRIIHDLYVWAARYMDPPIIRCGGIKACGCFAGLLTQTDSFGFDRWVDRRGTLPASVRVRTRPASGL